MSGTEEVNQIPQSPHTKGIIQHFERKVKLHTEGLGVPLVGLFNLLLLLQKPKANQRVQKPHILLPKSNFYYSTISKAPPPLLSSAFE